MPSPELTLIVAATRNMGIGFKGSMPWKGLRNEMQYFARVTSRVPPQSPPGSLNAVIMGRKTWDSIPPKFRPLRNRLNIIISRSASPPTTSDTTSTTDANSPQSKPSGSTSIWLPSLDSALDYLRRHQATDKTEGQVEGGGIARVFVIGGAQIYDSAAGLPQARRVLLTSIDADYECDTFFPLDLRGGVPGWARRERAQLQDWTGEVVDEGGQEEGGVRYEFQMWEREES